MPRIPATAALSALALSAAAATTTTWPLGGMIIPIAAGTITTPSTTSFAVPLQDLPVASGATSGVISALTTTTLTVVNAAWTPGALSTAQFPYAIQVTSGSAVGQLLDIATGTANTADTVTVMSNPISLGVAAGDTFRLIPIDTLNTLFGATTLLGGTSASTADNVTLGASSQVSYYYNTSLNRWVRSSGSTAIDRGATAMPASGVIYIQRRSAALALAFTGAVPRSNFRVVVPNSGNVYTHSGFPTDTTLGALAIQLRLPGWRSTTDDTLSIVSGASSVSFFHNGTTWVRTSGAPVDRSNVAIPAGSALTISRSGTQSGSSLLKVPTPYSL